MKHRMLMLLATALVKLYGLKIDLMQWAFSYWATHDGGKHQR